MGAGDSTCFTPGIVAKSAIGASRRIGFPPEFGKEERMTLFSELGHSLLWMALLSWAGSRGGGSARGGWVGALLAAGLSLLPGEWSPGFYTRALLGDLSALSWAYLLHLLLFSLRGRRLISRREGRALAWPALLGAILIYPSSLGAPGIPDLYSNDGGSYVLP